MESHISRNEVKVIKWDSLFILSTYVLLVTTIPIIETTKTIDN